MALRRKYYAVCTRSPNGWTAVFPSLPGCKATGGTWGQLKFNLGNALRFHLKALQDQKSSIPDNDPLELSGTLEQQFPKDFITPISTG